MPEQDQVYVNGRLFLGRVEEQKQFRQALQDNLPPPPGEELPYLFLLYGSGGIGKSTLARRFKDIAEKEPPFEGKFFALWIDWEDERRKHPALKVGRDQISVETVFERIHATIIQSNEKWGRYFARYQKMVRERSDIEKQAAEILTGGGGTNDEFSHKLVGATTSALAKIIRWQVPIGDTGEKLAQQFMEAGVEIGADRAASLRNFMQNKLQARLKTEQYQLFLNPHEQLTTALAEGLEQISRQKPVLFFFDTYEIVDRTDFWVKELIKAAGPKFIWVIGGRNNLVRSGQFGQEYVHGYAEVFPRRFLSYDVHQLARADVAAYFKEITAPDSLAEGEIDALTQATRGIPLALHTAGEIWLKGVGIAEIVGDLDSHTPHQEIVDQMTARYLLHVLENVADRQAIFALALAKGNLKVLQAMLEVEVATPEFDLPTYLQQLRRNYEAIHFHEARLHDEAAAYILSHLQQEERRNSWNIQRLNTNGEAVLAKEISQLEEELLLLEDRAEDDDWVQATLDRTQMLFWLDEQEGWKYFIPRFVEGLAYNRDLARGLLEIGARWQGCLSNRGNKRLKQLSRGIQNRDDAAEMIQELDRLNRAGWLQGEHEKERKAILAWVNGAIFASKKDLAKAQQAFAEAERGLSEDGTILAEHLGEALDDLAAQMMWPDGRSDAIFAPQARNLLEKAVVWLPEQAGTWNRLGAAYYLDKKYDPALTAYQQAIELNPEYATAFNNRGNTYKALRDFDRAIADYNRAIELNPEDATAFNNRGLTYNDLRDFDRAIADYNRAIELNPEYATAFNNRGTTYKALRDFDRAIADYNRAIELNPEYATAFNNRGLTYNDLRDFDRAIADYNRAIELNPEDATAFYNRGTTYNDLRDFDRAIADYNRAIELNPEDATAFYNRGTTYKAQGKLDEALADYNQAILLNPEDATAFNNRGNTYNDLRDFDRAIADYNRAIELNPEYATAFNNRGTTYKALRDFDRAIADYNRAIELNPEYATAFNNRGNTYKALRDFDRAIADYNRAIELNPEYATAFNNRGLTYNDLRDFDRAIADYNRAIELNPEDATAFYNRGTTYKAQGKLDEALADYNQAILLNPEDATAYNGLANLNNSVRNYEEAISAYQKAIEYGKEDLFIFISLAGCFQKTGQEQELDALIEKIRPQISDAEEYDRACFEAICGKNDEALALLRIGLEKNQRSIEFARSDPDFDTIRDDPRFEALLAELEK